MRKKRKKQVNAPVGSKAFKARMERQRARRKMDREGKDANKNGKADKREGKDVSHKKALSKGGSNKDGVTVEDSSTNRSRNYKKKKKSTRTRCVFKWYRASPYGVRISGIKLSSPKGACLGYSALRFISRPSPIYGRSRAIKFFRVMWTPTSCYFVSER